MEWIVCDDCGMVLDYDGDVHDCVAPVPFMVYGWNPSTRQSYLYSVHDARDVACDVAQTLSAETGSEACVLGPDAPDVYIDGFKNGARVF